MAVIVGSARIDENGNARGGKAGDQNKKEVSTQNWYKHEKGWRVLRPKDPTKAAKIAEGMKAACDNNYIGYDQGQRLTLYDAAKAVGFDISQVKTKVETDCSALVRVCLAYAGIKVANFRTTNQAKIMLASGEFEELTAAKYTNQSTYLKVGDVLVTKTQGHTVVVLSNGSKSNTTTKTSDILREGDKGSKVEALQKALVKLGHDLEIDGAFGPLTEAALKEFQISKKLEVDGVCGPLTKAALEKAVKDVTLTVTVTIKNGNCWVRTAPNTSAKKLGSVKNGTVLPYGGETHSNGWHLVMYKGQNGWVSGKYSKLGV
jgi:hypothetical protein